MKKASIIRFTPTKFSNCAVNLVYANQPPTELDTLKFLGLHLDNHLMRKPNLDFLLCKLGTACFVIRRLSHVLGIDDINTAYYSYLHYLLGKSYSVIGITKPNAHMRAITDSINLKTEKLTKKDIVILCGGTRDIAKNEANIGLRHISQFANSTADTNVIVTCAPTCLTCSPHLVSTRKLIPSTENYRNQ